MCLLELKKEQLEKSKNNNAEKFFKKRVLFCCFETKKNVFFLKKSALKQAHISILCYYLWPP